jgi:hypothetical protein
MVVAVAQIRGPVAVAGLVAAALFAGVVVSIFPPAVAPVLWLFYFVLL